MSYPNNPVVFPSERALDTANAVSEVLAFLVENPELLFFLGTLAASTAGDPPPLAQTKRALKFFAAKRQDFIDYDGVLGFVRWARACPDELRQLKQILFAKSH